MITTPNVIEMRDLRGVERSTHRTQSVDETGYSPFFGVFRWLGRRSRAEQIFVLVTVFGLTALLDFLVDPSLSLFALYLIPTLYSAWFLGIRWGYGTCLASVAVWAIDDWLDAVFYHDPLIPFWNLAGRLIVLTAIVMIVNALKNALQAEYESERRFVQRELEIARDVQMHLLPSEIPSHPSLDLGFIYRPAREVGGDYYDVIQIAPERFGIAVGDVAGKGVSSALLMASLQALVRTHLGAGNGCDIAASLAQLNTSLFKLTTTNRFATLFFGLVDVPSKTLCYVNAGHNPPLLFRTNGARPAHAALESLDSGGPPLGLFPKTQYRPAQVPLHDGDVLVAYTDGAVEALNLREEEFGKERLAQVVWEQFSAPATTICENIQRSLSSFVGDRAQFDDITLVVMKLSPA